MTLEPLSTEALCEGLATAWLGHEIHCFSTVGSTNDIIWELAEERHPHGTVVFADQQNRGRGSRGRVWHSTPGKSLLFSVLLRLGLPTDRIGALTTTASIGVIEAIREASGLDARILWPNDIMISDRKVGGILVESRSPSPAGPIFVLGVGLNVNQEAADLPEEIRSTAGSLRIEGGDPLARAPLAQGILRSLESCLDCLSGEGTDALQERLTAYSYLIGRRAEFETGSTPVRGEVRQVLLEGEIRLRTDDGREIALPAERVRAKTML